MNQPAPGDSRAAPPFRPKKLGRKHRWLSRLIAGIVALALAAFAITLITPRPMAWYVKRRFESGAFPVPADFAQRSARVRVIADLAFDADGAPDSTLDIYAPSAHAGEIPIVMWLHGGGFIAGDKQQIAAYATVLASEGYLVANVNYSLAPDARYPIPVRQSNAALGYLVAHAREFGGDPMRIFIGGDSAGAQIASQTAALQSDPAFAQAMGIAPALPVGRLRGAVLFCGFYDLATVASTGFPFLQTMLWSYTGDRDWEAYPRLDELSTINHVTADYPATLITSGDLDPFAPQSLAFAERLRANGVPVTARFFEDAPRHLGHQYQFMLDTPEALNTLTVTLGFLADRSREPLR